MPTQEPKEVRVPAREQLQIPRGAGMQGGLVGFIEGISLTLADAMSSQLLKGYRGTSLIRNNSS